MVQVNVPFLLLKFGHYSLVSAKLLWASIRYKYIFDVLIWDFLQNGTLWYVCRLSSKPVQNKLERAHQFASQAVTFGKKLKSALTLWIVCTVDGFFGVRKVCTQYMPKDSDMGCLVLQSNTSGLQLENFCRNGEIPEFKWAICSASSSEAGAPAVTYISKLPAGLVPYELRLVWQ